jgi:RecB family exonuclease
MTRAERRLVLSYPRSVSGSERDRSQFLDEAVGETGPDVRFEQFDEALAPAESEADVMEEQVHAALHGALVVTPTATAEELVDRIRSMAQVAVGHWAGVAGAEALQGAVARLPELGLEARPREQALDVGYEGPLRLSASALNTYATCPRQFQFNYILRIPQKMSPSAVAGSNVHRALEFFHKKYRDDWRKRSLDDLMAVYDDTRATKRFASEKEAAEWRQREERILREYLATEQGKAGEPKHFEAGFKVSFQDVEFHGYIDRIDEHADGSLEIIDYKTGRRETPNAIVAEDFQMPLYVLAMEERGDAVKAVSMYWMRDAGDGKGPIKRDVIPRVAVGKAKGEFTDEALDAFRGRVQAAVQGIRAGDFHEEPEEFSCGFCSYRLLCPAMEDG